MLPADGGPEFNRLIHEKTPYLLQHARNPVDWYPWGEEAFDRARKENKSIFLSLGYSTCHWCHVMERESFENPAIAALLNASFIAREGLVSAACAARTFPRTASIMPTKPAP